MKTLIIIVLINKLTKRINYNFIFSWVNNNRMNEKSLSNI